METITQEKLQQIVDEQKPEVKQEPTSSADKKPPMRQIIIETDGQNINLAKNELTNLEMMSIFSILLNKLNSK